MGAGFSVISIPDRYRPLNPKPSYNQSGGSMKHLISILFLVGLFLSAGLTQDAQLAVDQISVCTAIEDRVPVGADTVFSSGVGQLYCFTRISGADVETNIAHVWYFNGEEKANISLSVKGQSWRTWSSKKIAEEWVGPWRVEVVDGNGEVLASKAFEIKAQSE